MILLQYFKFFSFLLYAYMAGFILYKNPKSLLNITCAVIISSFAIWTIADPYLIGKNITKDTVILLNNIASIGWISIASFSVCFALVFSKREKMLKKKRVLILIFILPAILLYKQWTVGLNNSIILEDFGWYLSWKESFWTYLLYVYNFSFMLISIYIIYRHGTKTKQLAEKKQSKIIIASINISLIGVTITDLIMPVLDIHIIPQIGSVFLFVFAGGCVYAIVKYEFLCVSFAIAAENIISNMEELLILTDVEGEIININNAVIDSLKYEQKELKGQSIAILFSDNSLIITFLEKINTGEKVKNYETILLTKDTCEIPVIVSVSLLKDKRGDVRGILFIATDNTQHKQSEEALIEREKLVLESQEIARLGSYALLSNVKRLQELNLLQSRLQNPSTIEEKLKLITETVVQVLDADFARIWMIKPGDRCNAGCVHAQVTEGPHICRLRDQCLHLMASSGRYTHINGKVHTRVPFGCYKIGKIAAAEESKFLTNDVTTDPRVHDNAWAKELGLVSFAGYRLGDTPGNPLGVLALFSKHIITPEDDSYLELIAHSTSWVLHSEWDEVVIHQSEDRYQNLVESIPDWIWEVDVQGIYTYTSPAVRDMLGYEPEDVIGRSPFDFIPEDEMQQTRQIFKEVIAKQKSIVALENIHRHRDGRLIVLETNANPIFGHTGELQGYSGINRDITMRKQMEADLKESERLLRESQEIARLGSFSWNISNGLWTSSNILDRIFGIGESYIRSFEGWLAIIHPDFRELMKNYVTVEVLGKQQKFDHEYQIINQENKQERWVHGLGQLEFDSNHKPIKLIGTITDITERKKEENEIRINSNRLKALVDILQYSSHSIQDYLDFALNQAIEMTESKIGYIYFYNEAKNEFVLNTWSSEVMNECKIVEKQTVYHLEKTGIWGEAVRQRKPIVVNDFPAPNPLKKGYPEGHAPLYKYLTIPVFSNDEIIAVVAVANKDTDYTDTDIIQLTVLMDIVWKALEKKKSDDALCESEEKLNTFFASMTEMAATHELVFNEKGKAINYRITDCNNAFTTITGIKKENAIGKLATEVYQTDTPPHLDELAQVALTGIPCEFTEYSNDIDKYLMVSVISPTKNQFSTIATDITVIQQIQDEIKDKNKELENYLYVASHDLRSPLVNIQGFSQRFLKQSNVIKNVLEKCQIETETKNDLDKITNEDIPKTLNFIMTNVTKMENLINGLLQISRTGRVVMTIKKVDMNRLIKTIIASHNFQITELSAKVIIENLSDCYGDENLLNQLFSNIISNALKYRDSSRQLVIEIASRTQFNKLIYSIKDSGIGIESRHLEKIWNVFYRVDPGSDVPGEGIGLSLSRRITDKHKGKIWVESEVGKGSVFYVELQRNEFSE